MTAKPKESDEDKANRLEIEVNCIDAMVWLVKDRRDVASVIWALQDAMARRQKDLDYLRGKK